MYKIYEFWHTVWGESPARDNNVFWCSPPQTKKQLFCSYLTMLLFLMLELGGGAQGDGSPNHFSKYLSTPLLV